MHGGTYMSNVKRHHYSKQNREFATLLWEEEIPFEREFPLGEYTYDFKVGNTLAEIDPSATHNSAWSPYGNHEGKPIDYHQKKSRFAESMGFRVIHVWDWDDAGRIVKSLKSTKPMDLKSCEVRDVSLKAAEDFLNKHCIHGSCKGIEVCLGLYDGGRVTSAMAFGKPRYDKGHQWEMLRYCGDDSYCELLFNHFTLEHDPTSVIAYCDRSKHDGGMFHEMLGMQVISDGVPHRHWYNPKTHEHYTETWMRHRNPGTLHGTDVSNPKMLDDAMKSLGFYLLYDCGIGSYEWVAPRIFQRV